MDNPLLRKPTADNAEDIRKARGIDPKYPPPPPGWEPPAGYVRVVDGATGQASYVREGTASDGKEAK